jgi:hypothetical protein
MLLSPAISQNISTIGCCILYMRVTKVSRTDSDNPFHPFERIYVYQVGRPNKIMGLGPCSILVVPVIFDFIAFNKNQH